MNQRSEASSERRQGSARGGLWSPLVAPIYRMVRWIAGHARGLYLALGMFLLIGTLLATVSVAAFALIAERVVAGATQELDQSMVEWARGHRSAFLDSLAIVGAALGSGTATWIVLAIGSILLWTTRHHYSVLLLWLSLVGGRWLSTTLKALFDRPRPAPADWQLEAFGFPIHFPTSPSFPSGHAVTSLIVYGTLTYLVMRLEPTVRLRRLTLATATVLILLIGGSRVYLGVHYPSDVVAGFLAGFIWLFFAAFAIELLRYFVAARPELAREEKDLDRGLQPIEDVFRSNQAR